MIVELHPAAEAEAREAYTRYRTIDAAVSDRFIANLDRAIGLIADGPDRWPRYVHGTRRLVVRRFPYSIIYRVAVDHVLVLAIAHQKRRPGYWSRRGPRT